MINGDEEEGGFVGVFAYRVDSAAELKLKRAKPRPRTPKREDKRLKSDPVKMRQRFAK